ncbi:MAG: oligosaccharide flippase family protein, partial [Cyanobacteria bacterium J06649_11]
MNSPESRRSLNKLIVRGGILSIGTQIAKLVLTLLSTMLIARILKPEDFGLIAIARIGTNFTSLFGDLGLPMATIQKVNIDDQEISNLFWINLCFGIILFLLTLILAPLISWIYKDIRLLDIIVVLGCISILTGLSAQHQALLTRRMSFGKLALIEITSLLVSIPVGILFALAGWG